MMSGRFARTIAAGLAVAMVTAFAMAVPTLGALGTWKVVLGVVGIVIFVRAGRG